MVAATDRGLEHPLAHRAVLEAPEGRLLRRVLQREDPFSVELRSFAASAAAAILPSSRPASSALSAMTTADSFVSARTLSVNSVVSFASSWFKARSVVLSASELRARAHEIQVVALDEIPGLGIEPGARRAGRRAP